MLLIDYLEEAAEYVHERRLRIQKLERQFHRIYDGDLKKEMSATWKEIRKKRSEIIDELLLNLEEFRALNKYFPDLLQIIMEDENIGKVVSKKAWILDFKQLSPKEVNIKLEQLMEWRTQIKAAKETLRGWVGVVHSRSFLATFPILRGFMNQDMIKADALEAIKKAEKTILREGWLLLLSDSLIKIPIAKFATKISQYQQDENNAKTELKKALGKGTIPETIATRKLEEAIKQKTHFERILRQILLANPGYLKSLKTSKNWLSRGKSSNIEKFARTITPHSLKERAWLDEMKKKFG
ncbi:MAG: hypothetical protein ABID61_03995 [Candidatus Micrarchaeota archaeon]